MQVNDNGIISFRGPSFYRDPFPLNSTGISFQQIIAPYWANVDSEVMGNIFYRQTNDTILLARATNEIQSAFPTSSNLPIKNLFIATWHDVGYNFRHNDKVKYKYINLIK